MNYYYSQKFIAVVKIATMKVLCVTNFIGEAARFLKPGSVYAKGDTEEQAIANAKLEAVKFANYDMSKR